MSASSFRCLIILGLFFYQHVSQWSSGQLVYSRDYLKCDRTFIISPQQTSFASPNFPFNYTEKLSCRFDFLVEDSLKEGHHLCFQFRKFQLGHSEECRDDYLEFDGRGRFCGDGWLNDEQDSSVNIFQPFCVSLSGREEYSVMFSSAAYSTNVGFYSTLYISRRNFSDANLKPCDGRKELACFSGAPTCVSKGDLCTGGRCPDRSDKSLFYAQCLSEGGRSLQMCSFEDELCPAPSRSSNWARSGITTHPPHDHTTLSAGGHIMKTKGRESFLQFESHLTSEGLDHCLTFWYFMQGQVESLTMYIGPTYDTGDLGKVAWKKDGGMAYGWKLGAVDLDASWRDKFLVSFASRQDEMGSVSIDDISLVPHQCTGDDISCTFELGMCGWSTSPHLQIVNNFPQNLLPLKHKSDGEGRFLLGVIRNVSLASASSRPSPLASNLACISFSHFVSGPEGSSLRLRGRRHDSTFVDVWEVAVEMRDVFDWTPVALDIQSQRFGYNLQMVFEIHADNVAADTIVAIDNITVALERCPWKLTSATPPLPGQPKFVTNEHVCSPGSFECDGGAKCIDRVLTCNGFIDCRDTSDELNCPKTGGPLNYPDSAIQPSFLAAVTIIGSAIVASIFAVLFFVATRRYLRSRMNHLSMYSQSGQDHPDCQGDFPKPPPYSLHPPPYSLQAPPYHSSEQLNLKGFDSPPSDFSDSSERESSI